MARLSIQLMGTFRVTLDNARPAVAHWRWYQDVAGREIAAAARKRGRARDSWAAIEELLAELGETGSE